LLVLVVEFGGEELALFEVEGFGLLLLNDDGEFELLVTGLEELD
jgi:hypothetical protein